MAERADPAAVLATQEVSDAVATVAVRVAAVVVRVVVVRARRLWLELWLQGWTWH